MGVGKAILFYADKGYLFYLQESEVAMTPDSNTTKIDEMFYKALRGKTVTKEQAHILEWAQKRLSRPMANLLQEAEDRGWKSGREWALNRVIDIDNGFLTLSELKKMLYADIERLDNQ